MRMIIPTRHGTDNSQKSGLGFYEVEVYLVNCPLGTKTEWRRQSVFLDLAASSVLRLIQSLLESPAARNQDVIGRYHGDDPISSDHTIANLE
jgi:hypothetical protein